MADGPVLLAQAEGTPLQSGEPGLSGEAPGTDGHTLIEEVGVNDHAEEEHEGAFPPFDGTYFASQLLWLAITFVALYLVLSRVLLPRLGSIIEERRDRIASDLAEADQSREETDKAIAAYEQAFAEARAKAGAIARANREALDKDLAARRAAAEAKLGEQLAAAETRIADIKDQALKEVGTIASDTATAIVERLTGLSAGEDAAKAVDAELKG